MPQMSRLQMLSRHLRPRFQPFVGKSRKRSQVTQHLSKARWKLSAIIAKRRGILHPTVPRRRVKRNQRVPIVHPPRMENPNSKILMVFSVPGVEHVRSGHMEIRNILWLSINTRKGQLLWLLLLLVVLLVT